MLDLEDARSPWLVTVGVGPLLERVPASCRLALLLLLRRRVSLRREYHRCREFPAVQILRDVPFIRRRRRCFWDLEDVRLSRID